MKLPSRSAIDQLNQLQQSILQDQASMVEKAIQAGHLLIGMKKSVDAVAPKTWMKWCDDNIRIGRSQIGNYMTAARREALLPDYQLSGKTGGLSGFLEHTAPSLKRPREDTQKVPADILNMFPDNKTAMKELSEFAEQRRQERWPLENKFVFMMDLDAMGGRTKLMPMAGKVFGGDVWNSKRIETSWYMIWPLKGSKSVMTFNPELLDKTKREKILRETIHPEWLKVLDDTRFLWERFQLEIFDTFEEAEKYFDSFNAVLDAGDVNGCFLGPRDWSKLDINVLGRRTEEATP